jgi:uncharacterized membrane protein YdjX (TVP38/TMEM64 family)
VDSPPTPSSPPSLGRIWITVRLIVIAALVGLCIWLAVHYGWRTMIDHAVVKVQSAGAPLFFCAMALLPIIGFPLMPFALTAGPAFAPALGMPAVIALLISAVAINVTISYWIGSRWVAPALPWLERKFGWKLPKLAAHSAFIFMVVMRSAPGIPFWAQSYLLAALRVPFGTYLLVSTLIPAAYLSCIVVLGKALRAGQPWAAAGAAAVALGLGTILHFVRKRIVLKDAALNSGEREPNLS